MLQDEDADAFPPPSERGVGGHQLSLPLNLEFTLGFPVHDLPSEISYADDVSCCTRKQR